MTCSSSWWEQKVDTSATAGSSSTSGKQMCRTTLNLFIFLIILFGTVIFVASKLRLGTCFHSTKLNSIQSRRILILVFSSYRLTIKTSVFYSIFFQVLKTLLIFSNMFSHINLKMNLASLVSFVAFASSLNTFGKLMWEIMWSQSISRDNLFTSVTYVDLTRHPSKRCMHANLDITEHQN